MAASERRRSPLPSTDYRGTPAAAVAPLVLAMLCTAGALVLGILGVGAAVLLLLAAIIAGSLAQRRLRHA